MSVMSSMKAVSRVMSSMRSLGRKNLFSMGAKSFSSAPTNQREQYEEPTHQDLEERQRSTLHETTPSVVKSSVSVHTEWDPLEEVVIGNPQFANYPGLTDPWFTEGLDEKIEGVKEVSFPLSFSEQIIGEQTEDLETFATNLRAAGVIVKRPVPINSAKETIKTPDWEVENFFPYCPRDLFITIGDKIIETPLPQRSRYLEALSYNELMQEYFEGGANWISAPKQRLLTSSYNLNPDREKGETMLTENEIMFDAANVMKLGKDVIYLVSDSGNVKGGQWLQRVLGDEYKVHFMHNLYLGVHLDTTLAPIRPGLLLVNNLVDKSKLPDIFKSWDIITAPEYAPTPDYPSTKGFEHCNQLCSDALGMNLVMINPSLAAVDAKQTALIKLIESKGVDVMPTTLRHGKMLGGGPHCITLDTRRTGELQSYF